MSCIKPTKQLDATDKYKCYTIEKLLILLQNNKPIHVLCKGSTFLDIILLGSVCIILKFKLYYNKFNKP